MTLYVDALSPPGLALAQQVLVRQQRLHQIGRHGVLGSLSHHRLVTQTSSFQLFIGEARGFEHIQCRAHVGDGAFIHTIQNRAALGCQLHIAGCGKHRCAFPVLGCDQHHVAQHFSQGDAARSFGGHAALAQHVAVDGGTDRAGTGVELHTLTNNARGQHRCVFDAVDRVDGHVACADDQLVDIGGRNDLADFQATVACKRVVVTVLQMVHDHVAGGADVELAHRVFDRDGHVAVGLNVRQSTTDDHIAAHFQGICRQGHGCEFGIGIFGRSDRAHRDAAAQQQFARCEDVHFRFGGPHQGRYRDGQVGFEAVGVEVFQTCDRGHFGGDDFLAQPTAALFFRAIGGDFLVGKIAFVGVVGSFRGPVDRFARVIEHLDRGLVGGFDDAATQGVGCIGYGFAAAQLLADFPQLGVGEINHRELHFAVGAYVGVERVRLNVSHQ